MFHVARSKGVGALLMAFSARCALAICLVLSLCGAARNDNELTDDINIPQLTVDAALNTLAQQTGTQLLFPFDLVKTLKSNPVVGRYTLMEALEIMLRGSGLSSGLTGSGVITISRTTLINRTNQGETMQIKKPISFAQILSGALLAIFGTVNSSQVIAQDGSPPAAKPRILEEIIVTAQRRGQNLKDVGIAITALGSDDLDKLSIDSLEAIATAVSGLDMFRGNGSNNPSLTLRGVGTTNPWINNNQSVAAYVDGAYLPFGSYLTLPMFDLERVEVLKGPQIALYGRNATAGAVNFVSAKPTGETEGYLDISAGDYDKVDVKGAVSGALSDALQVRLAGIYLKGGGYIERMGTVDSTAGFSRIPGVIPGVATLKAEDDYGDKDVFVVRASADIQISDNIDAFFTYHHGRDKSELIGSTNTNGDRLRLFTPPNNDPFVDYDDVEPVTDTKQHGGVFRLNISFDQYALSSISSVENLDRVYTIGDFVPTRIAEASFDETAETFNQEILLTYDGLDRTHWMIGASYTKDEIHYSRDLTLTDLLLGTLGTVFHEEDKSYALFAQGEWGLGDNWLLTAGMRYTDEEKRYRGGSFEIDPYGTSIVGTVWPNTAGSGLFGTPEYNEDNLSGKLALNWQPSADTLFYLSISKGFKSGGFDGSGITNPSSFLPYKAETLWAYESGVKATFVDINTFIAASIFYYDYSDKQVVALVDLGDVDEDGEPIIEAIIQNAASSDVYGLDIEMNIALSDRWEFSLTGTFLDSEVTDWDGADPQETADRIGNELPSTPGVSLSGKLQWFFPINDNMEINALLWATYSEGAFRDIENSPNLESDNRTLVNARVDFSPTAQQGLSYYVYVHNLLDKEYVTSVRILAGMEGKYYGAPRLIGAGLKYRF